MIGVLRSRIRRLIVLETDQPHSRGVSCVYVYFYCFRYHPRIRDYFERIRGLHAARELFDVPTNRNLGRCAAVLEAAIQPVRSTSDFPALVDMQSGLQCWLCEKPRLCLDGGLSSPCSLLHFASYSDWERGGHGVFLQKGPCSVYGRVDANADAGYSIGTAHIRFRCVQGRI